MKKIKLKDCCEFVSDGDHLPPPKSDAGIPFITISDINEQNEISFENTMFVSTEYYDRLNETKKAKKGDVLYTVVGSFGKPVYIDFYKRFVFQRHIAILRPKCNVNSRFIYYVMKNMNFYKKVEKLAIGCSQKTITLDSLRNIEIFLPDKENQEKIVGILKELDTKISINNKINDNLLKQIHMLYDYYFLQFDFPDENGKPYNSSGGKLVWNETLKQSIPLKWSNKNIRDITSITWGQCPEGKNIIKNIIETDNNIDYCSGAGDMKGGFVVDCQAKTNNSKRLAHKNDILVSVAGKIGDMCVVDHTISIGRAAMAFTANLNYEIPFIYLTLNMLNKKMTTISSGSIQKVINNDHIDEFNFAYSSDVVEFFGNQTQPIFNQLVHNATENKKLQRLRDWLLPMLMNGQAIIEN